MREISNLSLFSLTFCFLAFAPAWATGGPFGPVYPVTASWFANRYSLTEWDKALGEFKAIGGDTVLTVGAMYNNRTKSSILQDKAFSGCVANGVHCAEDAEQELNKAGLKIVSWVTYENSENYGSKILACPLDKKIRMTSPDVTYYRVILHTSIGYDRPSCEFKPGTNVTVLFTAFTGADPHSLLLQSASSKNISIFLGLPRLPRVPESDVGFQMILSYSEWVYRALVDHKDRYGAKFSSTLIGYFSGDAYDLGDLTKTSKGAVGSSSEGGQTPTAVIAIYREVTALVHYNGKAFATAPSIDLRKSHKRALTDYTRGMMLLAFLGVDVIAVQEGRGLAYLLALHGTTIFYSSLKPSCEFKPGTNVTVLFTAFTGADPHSLLLQSASSKNISIYLGLPRLPRVPESDVGFQMILSYSEWVYRALVDHKDRYGAKYSSTLIGYFSGDAYDLGDLTKTSKGAVGSSSEGGQTPTAVIAIYREVTALVHYNGKAFATAPSIDLRKSHKRALTDYTRGMMLLAFLGVDVIAVQEGRGLGKSSYYGVNETRVPIKNGDPTLFQILKKNNPLLPETVTFGDVYIKNTQTLFQLLSASREKNQVQSELWLVVQAFDDLGGGCPIDVNFSGSDIPSKAVPVDKSRVDWAISSAGASVQKIAVIAWDDLYTYTDKEHSKSLSQQIKEDLKRPILSYCNFHNSRNLSVVVIGYNLEGMTQPFELRYLDSDGSPRKSDIGGYYFWLDYGVRRHLVPSLQYIMLWDWLPLRDMAARGYIYVIPYGAYHGCIFEYDFNV
ncbi:uncharacterized protein LOC106181681 [Lingula anatina]|uniref:Uncharacterized protein LOC106181681 n=1 Tax=Lingula anatina TaxID=7574 RepID=A0A1S3KGH6_LINAN|nr:uncharacterized protein LOC106181681 [Lingula anatina]|eukprot:XP_013421587.1 uncharacterized protein LOC106181681 [Lingula anatina]